MRLRPRSRDPNLEAEEIGRGWAGHSRIANVRARRLEAPRLAQCIGQPWSRILALTSTIRLRKCAVGPGWPPELERLLVAKDAGSLRRVSAPSATALR
jgi:hypothetical protein